jgi:hypothetical protein
MTAPVLQFKRGLLANLPGLRAGEPGFTTDSYDLYVGLTSETSTNKFFGSHRYWTKETTSTGSGLNLVEGTSNGSDYITIKSPDSLDGIVTYILPGTQGASSSVLTNDGSGNLTWASGSANPVFSGIATFSDTTDNTLGDVDTGAVQIDGGLGVAKNVTVGAGLSVAGESYFIGTATFYGGTLNLGDSDGDNINVAGEFVSNLVPNTDDTYDIGSGGASKRWRHASFSGIGTFATGLVADSVRLGIGGAGAVDTTVGNLTLDSASGLTVVNDNLQVEGDVDVDFNLNVDGHSELDDVNVSGVSTFVGLINANGGLDVTGHSELDNINVSGIATITSLDVQTDFDVYATTATFHNNVIVDGNFTVNGTETIINVQSLSITDKEIVLGLGTNGSPNDTSASGGGIAIASTEGNPLVDFNLAGIHTHPNTYKDIVWIRADDLGVGTTDAWHFNYAVGIGSTQVADGVRLAVTNTQITDSTLSTPQINVSGASTVGGLLDVNGGLDVSGGETILSSATVSDLTQGRVVLAGASGSLEDSTNLTFGAGGLIVGAGGINVTGVSTFSSDLVVGGDVRINGNDIQASDGNANITLTSNTLTTFAGDIRVNGNDIQASDGTTAITMSSANVTVAGDLTVGGNDIKASDGTTALTLTDSTGAVTAASDLTVTGNLYVSGNTTQVNTASLTVEDRTIELGIVDGSAPSSTTTWDLGVLFNYFQTSAKKSAVVWEQADARFKFGSEVSDGGGTDANSPQITFTAFAPIEIGALWVNDCAGQSQVISCTGTERFLENITIDAGTF